MARKRSWTDEEFVAAVLASRSIRKALTALGLAPTGGNYKEFHRHCKRLEVTTAHFHGQAHLRGKRNPWKRGAPLESILIENSTYSNLNTLKRRLVIEGVLPARCASCGGTEWLGRPIPLELDHINGVHDDHRRENLQLLCPNCHALTPTYRGRNKGTYFKPHRTHQRPQSEPAATHRNPGDSLAGGTRRTPKGTKDREERLRSRYEGDPGTVDNILDSGGAGGASSRILNIRPQR